MREVNLELEGAVLNGPTCKLAMPILRTISFRVLKPM